MRGLLSLLIVVLMVALPIGCAPPREAAQTHSTKSPAAGDTEHPGTPNTNSRSDPDEHAGPTRPTPGSAAAADAGAQIEFVRLNGGVAVPRCPRCGVVFREHSQTCSGCDLVVAPWKKESVCPQCVGTGVCVRCGDDRACLACAGDGACAYCRGAPSREGAACRECDGRRRCGECAGDGRRLVSAGDTPATRTALPGICPTCCVGGSGLCPDCGGAGTDAADAQCATCAGRRSCPDCAGTGICPHDRGDGLCAVCGGSGREIVNGAPLSPSARTWTIRRSTGETIVGRVIARPSPDLSVLEDEGPNAVPHVLVREKVAPLSYYIALRDHTSLDDTPGRVALADEALRLDLLPLALVELRRAAADRSGAQELDSRRREVVARLVDRWFAAAEAARASGDRDGALLYAHVAASRARNDATAARARALARDVRRAVESELAALSEADRARRDEADRERVARTVLRARGRMQRAEERLREAHDTALAQAATRTVFEEADHAAWAAERLVGSDAHRLPPSRTEWPTAPRVLIAEARALRARIAVSRAALEVAAGRFSYAARLARRARELGADEEHTTAILREAELGMARMGVLTTTPAPVPAPEEE